MTFFPIALDHMMAEEPQAVKSLLDEVLPQFADKQAATACRCGRLRMPRVVDALRHMARAEHIGKVVDPGGRAEANRPRSRWRSARTRPT